MALSSRAFTASELLPSFDPQSGMHRLDAPIPKSDPRLHAVRHAPDATFTPGPCAHVHVHTDADANADRCR